VSDELVGTTFAPHDRVLSARKLWIAFAAEVSGLVRVDAGARRALTQRASSLLPAGVVATEGTFETGQVIEVVGPDGDAFARGIASARSTELAAVFGRHTSALPEGMAHAVVHRDDLVVLA